MKWIKELTSIEEARVSTLIVCLLASLIFGLVMYYFRGDITDSLVNIIMSLIATVGGVNIADKVTKYYSSKKEKSEEENEPTI